MIIGIGRIARVKQSKAWTGIGAPAVRKGSKFSRGKTICPPPIAADLRPYADGSAVRTAPVASQLQAANVPPIAYRQLRHAVCVFYPKLGQTDGWCLMHNKSVEPRHYRN